MERPLPLLLLLAALLPAAAAATFGPQPGAPCETTLLATQAALFCASDAPPSTRCCALIVAAVDLGGGVPCLCRVTAEPQLVMAGLDASHLLALYTSCAGLQDDARVADACQDDAPQPSSSEKPSSPAPQEHDGAAHAKAAQSATSRLAPAAAATPLPQPAHSATVAHDATAPPPSIEKPPSSPLPSSKRPSPPPQLNGGDAPAQSKPIELVFLVLGYVFTGVLYLSPTPAIWRIFTTNEVGLYTPDVLVLTLCSCVVGLIYGVPDPFKKAPVIFNGVGIAFQIVYLAVYFRSCPAAVRRMLSICVFVMGCAVGILVACVFLLAPHPRDVLALFSDVITVAMYAGPIRQMRTVWGTKNVDHMSVWMAGASLLSGIFRTVYAFLTRDWFNGVSYIIGAISGLVQLTLFLKVKLRYQQNQQ